jgi:hypothetical protein
MPTEIRRSSSRVLSPAAADANPNNNLIPITIIAILIFVFHLASAAMIKRSQASPAVGPVASAALAAEPGCVAESRQSMRPLPFD